MAPAPELLRARTTLSYTVEALRRLEQWAHEAERLDPGRYGELIDHLRVADKANESGTPAAVLAAIEGLLGS